MANTTEKTYSKNISVPKDVYETVKRGAAYTNHSQSMKLRLYMKFYYEAHPDEGAAVGWNDSMTDMHTRSQSKVRIRGDDQ